MSHCGGSRKTATPSQNDCSTGTIPAADTPMDATPNSSAAPERNLSCERGTEMLFGSGEDSKMIADKSESIAQYSEMRADANPPSLSDRLTPLLISAGLVKGIIPLSMRDASGQLILEPVLRSQAGGSADAQKVDL